MAPRIVYLSWPTDEICGGTKMVFRHVEALREKGFEAVVATADGLPPSWFPASAPVIPCSALTPGTDILVFPENNATMLGATAGWPNRKVVFCQNQFMIYRGLGGRPSYADYGVTDILCCGHTVAAFCQRRFPALNVHVVVNTIDINLFVPRPPKRLQIAFMPRKRPQEAQFIIDLFRSDSPPLRGIPWVEIALAPEGEVARILGQSAVFLSLCRLEAYALTLLEAMASGCLVAGFTGFGARDYTNAQNGFWAVEDDCIDCTEQLTRAVRLAVSGGPLYLHMVEQGLATASSPTRGEWVESLARFWECLMPVEAH